MIKANGNKEIGRNIVNGDPYRNAPQPADRRVINRSGAAAYRADEPQPISNEAPKTAPRPVAAPRAYYDEPKKSSKWPLWIAIIVALVALGVAAWLLVGNMKSGATGIDDSKYQAVFLTNGQIYFGKLSAHNNEYLRLTTGYYPQAKTTAEGEEEADVSDASGGIQLIRLGDEVYGPENEIFVSKDQILHYENLKPDSKVSQLIDQNERAKQ